MSLVRRHPTIAFDELGSRATLPVILYFGLLVVTAIVVVIVAGPKHLSRKRRKQEESLANVAGPKAQLQAR
jgi:hypothetical protein